MIVVAAVCPPAPLLVPGLAEPLAARTGCLRPACERAVAALRGVDRVVILSAARGAAAGVVLRPGAAVSAAGLARSDRVVVAPVRLPGTPMAAADTAASDTAASDTAASDTAASDTAESVTAPSATGASVTAPSGRGAGAAAPVATEGAPGVRPAVAVGTAVGASLLAGAGIEVPTTALQLSDGAGVRMTDVGTVGLLVMADGAACHGEHAPGAPDPRSEAFDADLVTALRSGDPAVLARTCARLAGLAPALRDETLPALAAMAALTAGAGRAAAELLHYSAPFGVGYPVALWLWGPR